MEVKHFNGLEFVKRNKVFKSIQEGTQTRTSSTETFTVTSNKDDFTNRKYFSVWRSRFKCPSFTSNCVYLHLPPFSPWLVVSVQLSILAKLCVIYRPSSVQLLASAGKTTANLFQFVRWIFWIMSITAQVVSKEMQQIVSKENTSTGPSSAQINAFCCLLPSNLKSCQYFLMQDAFSLITL